MLATTPYRHTAELTVQAPAEVIRARLDAPLPHRVREIDAHSCRVRLDADSIEQLASRVLTVVALGYGAALDAGVEFREQLRGAAKQLDALVTGEAADVTRPRQRRDDRADTSASPGMPLAKASVRCARGESAASRRAMSGPVPPTDPRQRRRDEARRTYALLLTSARDVFAERGPHATVTDIAARAGVDESTLDRYFPDRRQLFTAAYADAVTRLCAWGAALLRQPAPADALFGWLEACAEHAVHTRELERRIADIGAPDHDPLRRWRDSIRSRTEALLRRAQRRGAVREDVRAVDLVVLIRGLALAGANPDQTHRLLESLRDGVAPLGWPLDGGHAASC